VRFASRREEPPRLRSGSRGSALAVAAVLSLVWPRLPLAADLLDFPASSRFDIFDGDGAKVVGYASYDFRPVGPGSYVLHGENRFFDGQYDVEEDEVRRGGPDTPATPVTGTTISTSMARCSESLRRTSSPATPRAPSLTAIRR